MRQYNHWKLQQLQKIIVKVTLWGFGLILLFLVLFLKEKLNFDLVSGIVGGTSFAFGLAFSLLEKILWKTRIMNLPFLDNYWTPNLEGRWKGTLTRDGTEHAFVLEIRQTFTTISCVTYSTHSSSSSYAAEILYDEHSGLYKLIYYWQAKTTTAQKNTGDTNIFNGLTILNISVADRRIAKLEGSYFTDRQPKQTRGQILLQFDKKTLINSFN